MVNKKRAIGKKMIEGRLRILQLSGYHKRYLVIIKVEDKSWQLAKRY